jgi:hypothetical protein
MGAGAAFLNERVGHAVFVVLLAAAAFAAGRAGQRGAGLVVVGAAGRG